MIPVCRLMEKLLSHCHLLEGNASIFSAVSLYGWMNGKLIVVLKSGCQKTRQKLETCLSYLTCCVTHSILESLNMPLHAIHPYFIK